ncbi:Uncharacterised protein [uncultured archaeon]|nr:Uncharacterised protein [uncultured archaeon]
MRDGFWTKGLVLGIIILFLGASVLPSINGNEFFYNEYTRTPNEKFENDKKNLLQDTSSYNLKLENETLDQFQLLFDRSHGSLILPPEQDYQSYAQSFIPNLTQLTKVELVITVWYHYNNDPLIISIRDNLSGSDLTSISIPANNLPEDNDLINWTICDFPDIVVNPGKTYFIVLRTTGKNDFIIYGNVSAFYHTHFIGDPYTKGTSWAYYYHGDPGFYWENLSSYPYFFTDYAFKTYGISSGNQPPSIPIILGQVKGKVNFPNSYDFLSIDPNADDISYFIDWSDTTNSGWIGPYSSGEQITESHIWSAEGNFTIKVKAKDTTGHESDWGVLTVTMPCSYTKLTLQFLELLFQRFPNVFPILRRIVGY